MKDDKENKTYKVEYTIDIPVVIFSYKTKSEKEKPFLSKDMPIIQCSRNSE